MKHPRALAAFAVGIAALFASSEVMHATGVSAEVTRRYTHAGGAVLAAFLPAFVSLSETAILGASLTAALAATRSHGLLRSVHGVERRTLGATLFPVGLVLAAVIGWRHATSYVLAALVLGLADPAAAIAGRIGGPGWHVAGGSKSLAGSLGFFATTVAIGLVARAVGVPLSQRAVLATAAGSTAVEGSLGLGLDNLALPPFAVIAWRSALRAQQTRTEPSR